MRNFLNKVFNKSKVVRVIELTADKRYREHYIKPEIISGKNPKGMRVSLADGRAFNFTPNHVNTFNGYKTIFVAYDDAEAYDPLSKEFTREFSPQDYANAIEGKVVQELFKTTKSAIDLPVILSVLTIVALIGLGLLLYQEVNSLKEIISGIAGGGVPVV